VIRRLVAVSTIAGAALVLSATPATARNIACIGTVDDIVKSVCVPDPFPTIDALRAKVLPAP
jgi:hypothetical protein